MTGWLVAAALYVLGILYAHFINVVDGAHDKPWHYVCWPLIVSYVLATRIVALYK
jgi:hypothetical protein